MEQDPGNITPFFEYDEVTEEMERQYNGFRHQNEAMINWACQMTDADLKSYRYRLSDPAKEVPLVNYTTSDRMLEPIIAFFEKKLYGKAYKEVH